eukprot:75608_1
MDTTATTQVISTWSPDRRLVYIQSSPPHIFGHTFTPRDFALWMCKINPSKIPGSYSPGSLAFVQVNRRGDIPLNKKFIRGDVNSMLLFEPIGPKYTKMYYAVEISVNGKLPVCLLNGVTANMFPMALVQMRNYLEQQSEEGIEEKEPKKFGFVSQLNNVMTSREEPKEAEKVLNRSLAKTKEGNEEEN